MLLAGRGQASRSSLRAIWTIIRQPRRQNIFYLRSSEYSVPAMMEQKKSLRPISPEWAGLSASCVSMVETRVQHLTPYAVCDVALLRPAGDA
jgi:hypothetical protein